MFYARSIFLFLSVSVSVSLFAGEELSFPKDIKSFFKGFQSCVAIRDIQSQKTIVFNKRQCQTSYYPNSTFKIANSLIGLESGVIADKDFVIPWDGKPKYFKSWEKDHSLASAIKVSAVPYYKELARRVGPQKSSEYLKVWNYGNFQVGSKHDSYWLNGPLKISAMGQIVFLEKLYTNKLQAKQKNMEILREIIELERTPKFVLSGKTGSFMQNKKVLRGWFVGHLKNSQSQYVFAVNIIGKEKAWGREAQKLFRKFLTEMGMLK
jgi:beta-lactamase class D